MLDVTDFVDVYALGSPWTSFSNLTFSTGAASMALPNDASPGFMLGGWVTDNVYITGGMSGLNSDPTDPWAVFYRAQVTENLRVTPSVQLLANPALNPTEDLVAVFGMRGVLSF
jgi:hypothetical protein